MSKKEMFQRAARQTNTQPVTPLASLIEADQQLYGSIPQRAIQPIVSEDGTLVDYGQFRLTSVGLQISGEITVEQWQQIGEVLAKAKSAVKWWIGDWIQSANAQWGSTYDEAMRITNYSLKSLQNIAYIAGNVDFSLRREKLSFAHYAILAPMSHEDQAVVINRLDEMWRESPNHKAPTVAAFHTFIYGSKPERPVAPISRKYSGAFNRIRKAMVVGNRPTPRDIQLLRELVTSLESEYIEREE